MADRDEDMEQPATRRELKETETILRAELKETETILRAELKETETTLRGEIKEMGTTLRAELKETETILRGEIQEMGTILRGEMEQQGYNIIDFVRRVASELKTEMQNMRLELAQHANAIKEHVTRELRGEIEVKASSTEVRAVDDKYADLPARVTKLERAVFPPKRQRRR